MTHVAPAGLQRGTLQLHVAFARGLDEHLRAHERSVTLRAVWQRQFVSDAAVFKEHPEYSRVPPSAVSARTAEQVRDGAAASGLLPLFQELNLVVLDTDVQRLERAVNWLVLQGARTVADLRELPPGTYTCKELADSLGLPLIMAQRLLTAIEGTKSSAIHHKVFMMRFPRQVLSSCTRRRRRSSPSRRRQ